MTDSVPFGTGGLVFIGVYLLSLIGIGWLGKRASREKSLRDFYLGGKGVGFLVLWLTLFATQYSGNTIIGFTGKSARIGFAWITAVQFMIAIVISYQLFAPRLHQLAKKHGFITPTDYLNHRFRSRALNLLGTAIMVAALGNFFLAQLTAMGRAVEGLTTYDAEQAFAYGVIGLAAIMLIYELLGGFRAVAWTDVIQGSVLALGFVILLVLIFQQFGSPGETTRKLLEHSPEKALPPEGQLLRQWINFLLLFGFAGALYPQAIQRIYAAKSSGALRKGLAAMSFMPLCATLVAILVGVAVAAHLPDQLDGANSDTALTVMLRQVAAESWFGGLLVLLILAAIIGAIMSTGDSALLSISSMLTKDIYQGVISPDASQKQLTLVGKGVSIVLVFGLTWLTIYLDQLEGEITLVQLLGMKFDMLIQLAPAFMIGIHWKGMKPLPTLLGMAVGLVFSLSFFWVPPEGAGFLSTLKTSGFNPGLYGLLLNLVISVGGSWLLPKQEIVE
ncbi:MAG: sodium:solute symporter family protein [Verrucomicrobiales bacterium]|nr:sodium:solute symporter family protein [Verrucomicrobiales bacterium]